MAAAGLASTAAAAGAAGDVSAGLAWTAADCCIGAGAGAGVSLSAKGFTSWGFTSVSRSVDLDGEAFGIGTDCGMRLAILGTKAGGRGALSRRVIGSIGPYPYDGRGAPP